MSRQIVLTMILFLCMPCLLYSGISYVEVEAPNGYPVHNLDTGLNYTSIQEAINAPETLDGHTIFVEEGTYFEHVTVGKSLTLLGEDREATVIDGNLTGNVVRITRDYVNIRGLTIQRSGRAYSNSGIYIGSTRHCDISANCIVDNDHGVYGSPRNMSITDNTIEGNFLGVAIDSGATNNVISRNHLVANHVSVHLNLADANYILQNNMTNNWRSVTLWDSKNNTLYHNNFLNNTFGSVTDPNFLDNGFEGNYWSNYTGVDLNHDGIGDSPYVIDANHTDHYPLMGMFYGYDTYYGYAVAFVSNSSISSISFDPSYIEANPEEAMLALNVSGDTGTEGFVRVCIPKILINGSYLVMFDGVVITNATIPQVRELPCSNETHTYFYINYTHSEHTITIIGTTTIPEFPSFLILPFLILVTTLALLATIAHKRMYPSLKRK